MRTLSTHFKVFVEHEEIEQCRAEVHKALQQRELGHWLHGLTERLRQGIANGTYIRLPTVHDEEVANVTNDYASLQCLRELIDTPPMPGVVIWIDDRWATGHSSTGQFEIIGIIEMMNALMTSGALTHEDYLDGLAHLRRSNAWFIPVTTKELIHLLEQTKVSKGLVTETHELRLVRRTIAANLTRKSTLIPPKASEYEGELRFAIDSRTAAVDAISYFWQHDDRTPDNRARANWVLQNMYISTTEMAKIFNLTLSRQDLVHHEAADISLLILQGLTFDHVRAAGSLSIRRQYISWLFERLITSHLELDSRLLSDVSAQLINRLKQPLNENHPKDTHQALCYVCREFIEDLPNALRQEIDRDTQFLATIGRVLRETISTRNQHFDLGSFWSAIATSINGHDARLTSLTGQEAFIATTGTPPNSHTTLTLGTGENLDLVGLEFSILIGDLAKREALLHEHRTLLDIPDEQFKSLATELASTVNPSTLAQKVLDVLGSSTSAYYAKLRARLHEQSGFGLHDLRPPSGDSLLRHFRLHAHSPQKEPPVNIFETASESLLREVGIRPALARLMSLPIPLPNSLIAAIHRESLHERRNIIRDIIKNRKTPISEIHLVHILWTFTKDNRAYSRLALRLGSRMLCTGQTELFNAFSAILKWTNENLEQWHDTQAWSSQLRLATSWGHAHQLLTLFVEEKIPLSWLSKTFEECRHGLRRFFSSRVDSPPDVAHPQRLNWLNLTTSGLAYAFDGATPAELDIVSKLAIEKTRLREASDVGYFPDISLLFDASLAPDCMGSFLAGDRSQKLAPLLGPDCSELLSRENLGTLLTHALESISADCTSSSAWLILKCIANTVSVHPEFQMKLENALTSAKFTSIVLLDRKLGIFALRVACEQAAYSQLETARTHLQQQWIEVLRAVSSQSETSKDFNKQSDGLDFASDIQSLLEAARDLALLAKPPETSVGYFSDTVMTIIDHLAPQYQSLMRRFIDHLSDGLSCTNRLELFPIRNSLRAI
ncbi:hypothetical protein [Myxococcus qinghaiensis]|uniref:hypothetical protein n=1 Tax=Myxococcus qinghaiensis TaxID=2906758 RepID=UPI0020A6EA9B|nr:hypothetical protein [Myxococcus qinghaiensis]MCP3165489.1 hypothetical protein [Myxococcus qinghaiensis]